MAELINNKYPIKIEVLTPLSVGAGEEKNWKQNVDYIIKDGKLYHLSLKKMVESGIDVNKIANYFSKPSPEALRNLISENQLEQYSDIILDCPVECSNDYKSFIRNDFTNKPYIPGSSIKGAIRSGLLHSMLKGQKLVKDKNNNFILKESDYFGVLKYGEDFMRYIKIADCEFEKTELVNSKIYNLRSINGDWEGGWKHGANNTDDEYIPTKFNTIYESLTPTMSSIGSISISKNSIFKHGVNTHLKKEILNNNGIIQLFKCINECTKEYLNAEKKFFEVYDHGMGSDEILASIDSILDLIPTDNSYCILKMSAGTGFHSITGNWQYKDFTETGIWDRNNTKNKNLLNKKRYKSHKIADYKENLTLMGFIKISLL